MTSGTRDKANWNTARPSICRYVPFSQVSDTPFSPSEWIFSHAFVSCSSAVSTTAPAPSPNRMQVPRSLQSTRRLRASAPISSTFFALPLRIYSWPSSYTARNPVQAALTSRQAARKAPISSCTRQAVFGKMLSDEEVPTRIRSSSVEQIPAFSSALLAAFTAIWATVSSPAMWRAPIPVRSRIQISLVSTIFSRSSFFHIVSGTYEPVPAILPFFTLLSSCLFHSQTFFFSNVLIFKVYHQNSFCQPFFIAFSISHFYNETMFGIFSKLFFRILLF